MSDRIFPGVLEYWSAANRLKSFGILNSFTPLLHYSIDLTLSGSLLIIRRLRGSLKLGEEARAQRCPQGNTDKPFLSSLR